MDRIEISTTVSGKEADLLAAFADDPVQFLINPSSVSINRDTFGGNLRRSRGGFVRTFVGNGPFVINFSGSLNLNPYSQGPDSTVNLPQIDEPVDDIRTSIGYKFMQGFQTYVAKYQKYLFRLRYFGAPIDLSEAQDPVFKGNCSIPTFSQDADKPMLLNYSFVFTGVIDKASDPDPKEFSSISLG